MGNDVEMEEGRSECLSKNSPILQKKTSSQNLSNLTQELQDIFSGKIVPKVRVVDYSTPEKRKELQELLNLQRKIEKRKEVDWNQLNKFRITI